MVCRSPPVGRHNLTLRTVSAVVATAADWARCGEASQKSVGLSFLGLHDLHHVCEPSVALTFQNKCGVKKSGLAHCWRDTCDHIQASDGSRLCQICRLIHCGRVECLMKASSLTMNNLRAKRLNPRLFASSNFLVFCFYLLVFYI